MFVRVVIPLFVVVALAALVLARPSSGSRPERIYVVRAHDTLWSIAAREVGGDPREAVWEIEQRNGLRTPLIRPGQRLRLP